MWRRAIEAMRGGAGPSRPEWYRRTDVWLILVAVLVPFGWVVPLCRFAWTSSAARRDRRHDEPPRAAAIHAQPDTDHALP
jgi:hypothetical protein